MGSQKEVNAPNKLSISDLSFKAIRWNYFGALARVALQFVIGIILARLLGPESFGLVALASLVLGLGALFADFGLASALVQRKEISSDDIRYVFTLQSLFGLALTVILEIAAETVAKFFGRLDALPIMRAMFLLFFIQGLGQTSGSLLRRNMEFKSLQVAQIVSYLLGYAVIGVPLALRGFGVWSLVIAQLVQVLLCSLVTYCMTLHPITPTLRSNNGSFITFGFTLTVTNLINWTLSCLDSLVIGRVFGSTQLGVYNRTFSLVAMPTYSIISNLQSVLFSASSRMQDDKERLQQTYLAALGIIGFVCLPTFFAISLIPTTMINAVYGKSWSAAITLLPPLALAMPFCALMGLGGPLMTALNRPQYEMKIQFISLLLFIPLIWWAAGQSPEMVAWSVFISYALRFLLVTFVTLKMFKITSRAVAQVLAGPAFLAAICTTSTFFMDKWLHTTTLSDAYRLACVGLSSATVALFSLMLGGRWLISNPVAQLLRKMSMSMPVSLKRLIIVRG